MKKFWMVWRLDGRLPSNKHMTLKEARLEARRLTEKENDTFVVLEATHWYKPKFGIAWGKTE